jgi:RHS repeat-associated protein
MLVNTSDSAPVAVDDSYQIHGSTQIGNLLANDFDPDGDSIGFGGYGSSPLHGTLLDGPSGGIKFYTPNSAYVGQDSFTYRVCQGNGLCSGYATVTLTVNNQAPTPASDSYGVHGQTQLPDFLANDSDPDGDPFSFNGYVTSPQHGQLIDGDTITTPYYRPDYAFVGTDSFSYRICDVWGLCAVASVTLTVVNQPPTPANDSYNVHGQTQLTNFMANDSDPDNDSFSFNAYVTSPQHGHLIDGPTNSTPFYQPNSGFVGTDGFSYRICDAWGLCAVGSVTITVNNQAPTAVDDSFTVHGGTQLPNFLANDFDADHDPFSFNGYVNVPQHGLLVPGPTNTTPFYVPNNAFVGSDSFTYRICDSLGLCSVADVHLSVVNQAPTPADDSFTVHGGTQLPNFLANDSDPDNDPFSFNGYVTFPQHGHLIDGPTVSTPFYQPDSGFVGADAFTYRVCDSLGLCTVATITITVANQPPHLGNDSYSVHRQQQLDLMANDSDPDNDPIAFDSFPTNPEHGVLLPGPAASKPIYKPNTGYLGPDHFFYRVCDSLGLCAVNIVSITVVNQAPTPAADYQTIRGMTQLYDFVSNDSDPDSDPISFSTFVSFPQHGHFANGPTATTPYYVPNAGFVGTDSFTYRICDDLGLCADGTVKLFVVGECENCGKPHCKSSVGEPVNATNGNMYLQQNDYQLPGVGFGISVTRAYNSQSQSVGLFGRGWSSTYDESILPYDDSLARLNQNDGRAVYFGKISGAFTEVVGDAHVQLSQNSGYTVTLKNGAVKQFDSSGKLVSLIDRAGNTTSLTYDANGHLSSVTDPFGRLLTVTTNANGLATSISDSLGTIATYTYGGSSELLSVTYADNSAFNFTYDGSLRLTTVTDALGNVLESHTYDGLGRAITSEKQNGVDHYSLSYVSNTETDVTDGLGRLTKYTFDSSKGRNVVTRVEGLCGCAGNNSQVQSWTYDDQLNETSVTDALNHVTSYTYDGNGNRLTRTDSTGTITYTYNGFAEVLTRRDQMNFVTTNTYDGQGNLLTTTDALNNPTTLTYNSRGQILTATDARGKVTTFTYDTTGNLTRRTDANSIITFYFYDARSRLTKVRDGLSRSTLFAYDAFGRINKVTHPDLSFVSFTYDLAGRRTTVTDERGNATNYGYDGAYRLTSVTDALSHTTNYSYDLMSNPASVTDALSRTTNYDYDAFNRLVKITYPPATAGAARLFETTAYDANGNVTSRTDTANRTTTFAYDNANRVSGTTDAANHTSNIQYDPLSRVTSLTDAVNQQYQFGYDALGRQTSLTRGGVSMSFVYDETGNRTQRTDYNGVVTNYAYDNLNRLTTITYPTRTVAYNYDVLSHVTRVVNENGAIYLSYDNRYRLKTVTDPFFYGITYDYDTVGNRSALKVNGSNYATYTYDATNRMTALKDSANLTFNFNYDAVDRLNSRSAPNGVNTTYGYDDLNRLTSLIYNAGATTLNGNLYTFNDASNITGWTTQNAQRGYTYDSLDRLTGATNFESPVESYGYDAVGNRTSSHLSATYNYQSANKLTSTANATYSYDNNGNMISRTDASGTTGYTYNEENQLTHVVLPSGLTIDYKYDGLGRRMQRTTSGGADERYVYDRNDVLLDLNADWSVATTYLNDLGPDNHLRQTNSATGVSYFLNDHLGSIAAITDASGSLVEQLAYDSFGNGVGSARTRYGFTGRERDPDTGLLYYRARFYDPQIGRFVSEDPAGLAGGVNGYSYTRNNPIKRRDPSGLFDIDFHYYLTYYIAKSTGCFWDEEARQMAEGDQRSDEDDDKKPGWGIELVTGPHGALIPIPNPAQQARNANFHAFGTHEQNDRRAAELFAEAIRGNANPYLFGTYLHFIQDSFSHFDFAGNTTWGQFSAGKSVDHTSFNPDWAFEAAEATYYRIEQFARIRGCNCKDEPDWQKIREFIKVGYDTTTPLGRNCEILCDVSDEQLREKIRILDVPWRSADGRRQP